MLTIVLFAGVVKMISLQKWHAMIRFFIDYLYLPPVLTPKKEMYISSG